MHRFLKNYAECPNIYSFVFPKNEEATCVTALESQFSAIPPKFTVTLEKIISIHCAMSSGRGVEKTAKEPLYLMPLLFYEADRY